MIRPSAIHGPRSAAALVCLVLGLVVVGGCSSAAVDGQGSIATPPARSITGFPSSTAASSTPVAPPTSPTSSPTNSPASTSAPPAPAVKVCPRRSDPPFCYSLPDGFRDYSGLKTYGKGWQYKTLVSVGRHDLVEVLGSREKGSYDKLSDSQLRSNFDRSLKARPGHYSVRRAGPVRKIRIGGARAFEQHAVFTDGVQADTTTVFHGHVVVSIGCQSQSQKSRVHAACGQVQRSIDIG